MRGRGNRLGFAGYAELTRALIDQPHSSVTLQQECGIGHAAAQRFLHGLHSLGWLYVHSWELARNNRTTPRFAFGVGVSDAKQTPSSRRQKVPATVAAAPIGPRKVNPELIAFAAMLGALQEAMTRVDLVAAVGIHKATVSVAIRAMREHRIVHVAEWDHPDRRSAPVERFQFAVNKNDAPRPKPTPKPVRQAVYRRRRRLKAAHLEMLRAFQPLPSALPTEGIFHPTSPRSTNGTRDLSRPAQLAASPC